MSLRGPLTLQAGRRLIALAAPAQKLADGVTTRHDVIAAEGGRPDVRVVVYEHDNRQRPSGALVWIHGGGLVMGTPEQGDGLCSRIAAELGVLVVSVDYRLAPEHPFPNGLDDCYTALEWVHLHADELGVDPNRVAVGGDSAGGGLAAALAQMADDRGGVPVCFQLLQYPMLDDRTALRSGPDALMWSLTSNRWAWAAYLGHPAAADEARPYASASRRDDLTGLPPAWIGVGSIDLFHDECVEYANRLRETGVACDLHVEPGMYHAAEQLVPTAPSMRAFVDGLVEALGKAIGSNAIGSNAIGTS